MSVTTDQTGEQSAPPASSRPDAPPPPPGTARPRRRALWIVLVLALVAEAALGVRLVSARGDLNEADQQLDAEQAQLGDLQAQLDRAQTNLATIKADLTTRTGELDGVARSVDVRRIEIDQLDKDLKRLSDKAALAQADINKTDVLGKEQVQRLVLLNKCLTGIETANLAASAGRTDDTVAALKAISDICQQTLSIADPSGKTPDFPFDFADPSLMWANGKWFSYATNGGGGHVQVISSTDLKRWEWVGEALTGLPGWATPGKTWAPSVLQRGDVFYLYYTTLHSASGKQCISVAKSARPEGPFSDTSGGPLVCQVDRGGSIDPSPFVASDQTTYLLWKSEGETLGGSARLWIAKLGENFDALDGDPANLLGVDRSWEGRTVEAPSMTEVDGSFYLLYSANRWDTADYASGYARCAEPMGPCVKPLDNIILRSHDNIAGPGGTEVYRSPGGELLISYHAWTPPNIGYPNKRQLHVDRLVAAGGGLQVAG